MRRRRTTRSPPASAPVRPTPGGASSAPPPEPTASACRAPWPRAIGPIATRWARPIFRPPRTPMASVRSGMPAAPDFRGRVAEADAFVHVQDMPGQDVLDSDAFAEHEGGFRRRRRVARQPAGAVSRRYHRPGQVADPDGARRGRPRAAGACDQPELARRADAPRLPRRRGDRPDGGQCLRLRRPGRRGRRPPVRPAVRRDHRRRDGQALPDHAPTPPPRRPSPGSSPKPSARGLWTTRRNAPAAC